MQVDPIKPTLKVPGTKLLKLKYDKLLSNFAFKFNLCCYTEGINLHTLDRDVETPAPDSALNGLMPGPPPPPSAFAGGAVRPAIYCPPPHPTFS